MRKDEQEVLENYENDLKLAEKYGCFITKTKLADELLRVCKKQKEKIGKLQKENKELKDEIELHKADENTLQNLIREDEENINKLINYIAVRENKDYEDIRKEFDI